jgi:large subunit ribosomal protein L24
MSHRMKVRKDDMVKVISGKDRGKTGRVLRTEPRRERVYVEGMNIVKRHQRPVAGRPNMEVGVIEKEGAIHISNVALADPRDDKPTRIAVRRTEQGGRMRVAKRSGTEID